MFNQNPFFSPYSGFNPMMGGATGLSRAAPFFGGASGLGRAGSLFGGASGLGRAGSLLGGAGNVARTGFNWGGLLTNAQRTLGIINQAIPAFNQIKPIWNNARTMFRVFGELNRMSKSENNNQTNNTNVTNNSTSTNTSNVSNTNTGNQPSFYI